MTSTLSHRNTENSVYRLLDGDDSRIRQVHAQHNLAVLRRVAFNLLPSANSAQIDIAAKRERAGWKTGNLLKILFQQDAIALCRGLTRKKCRVIELTVPKSGIQALREMEHRSDRQ